MKCCKLMCSCLLAGLLFAGCLAVGVETGRGPQLLWQIGTADNDTREFALAPDQYRQFETGPTFLVGYSDTKRDWPYAHPGPEDRWAGRRRQTFEILFDVRQTARRGDCGLVIDLADTHSANPPKLRIALNDRSSLYDTPAGGSDDSISGNVSAGREHQFTITFPASELKPGTNRITITTMSGSWMLYDWIGFEAPADVRLGELNEPPVISRISATPLLVERDGTLCQSVQMTVRNIGPSSEAEVHVTGAEPVKFTLEPGDQTVDVPVPAVEEETPVTIEVEVAGETVAQKEEVLKPVRKWVVYLLPHSHVDIGYTHIQTEVERAQWGFLDEAVAAARRTANYPPGSRFKWNVEVLWAVDSYLKQASPEKRDAFIEAVKKNWIGLDALYGNELTALCRPEELVRLLDCARKLRKQYGVAIDAAMITDVPGYTWGMVPVLADSGVKYWSIGPNRGHRIGYTLSTWGDRPFYWVGPSEDRKVLCWVAGEGYSWFHAEPLRDGRKVIDYLGRLDVSEYPYDLAVLRYNIGGDNGPPDPGMCEFVRDWNSRYAYPRLVIATTSEMFREFEKRYGNVIPSVTGDFTPYWEDGAASSSRETGFNRAAAERLTQAERLWAMLDPEGYPAEKFYEAWRDVILYDEHTWGAHNSISAPEGEFAKGQWRIKQAFALDADRQSHELLEEAVKDLATATDPVRAALVFNTSSWPRTDIVVLPRDWRLPGNLVRGLGGKPVASQRLSTGELAFIAENVQPMGAARFTFHAGKAHVSGKAAAEGAQLSNGLLTLTIDETTGAIASLKRAGTGVDLVNGADGLGLNDYFYVAGRDPKEPQRNGPVRISVKENGPLVASLLIESDAPGCRKLTREIGVITGLDRVDIVNVIDKENIYNQEAVHLAFPFNVPDGVMRMDIPWAVVRPETDQMDGSCKNYFTVQRWVDVSNRNLGATWATVDAPLIEVGAITCDPVVVGWLKQIEPSTTLYSYVMNNYWETNYKAGQEGPTTFRYSIQPHGPFNPAAAARFGTDRSQPLVIVPVDEEPGRPPFVRVEPSGVVLTALKPSEDGDAWIVRLFGASGRPERATLTWGEHKDMKAWMSNLAEEQGPPVTGPVDVPPYGMVTLRAVQLDKGERQ